jgi:tetratricopeptide (TPR) repeat protein
MKRRGSPFVAVASRGAFTALWLALARGQVPIGLTVAASALAADVPVRLSDLNATLSEIAPHLRNYPPKFSTPEERVQTEEHLKTLLAQLDKISDRYPNDEAMLFIKAAANAMGHNLDYPGCAEKAIAAFDRLLAIDPSNRRALYEYGGFLSGTTLLDKAIPYLDRAIQLGEERAHYTLAFVYIKKGDSHRALSEFEAYLKADPENATAKKFVADIRSGKAVHIIRQEATESR